MTAFETVLLGAVASWLLVLTVVSVLIVRQIALLTVRLDRLFDRNAPADDGLGIGAQIPDEISGILDAAPDQPTYLLVLGASCVPCRQLSLQLGYADLLPDNIIALISGHAEHRAAIVELLPASIRTITDPKARELIDALEVSTTPFCFEIQRERIRGKTVLDDVDEFKRFTSEAVALSLTEVAPNGR